MYRTSKQIDIYNRFFESNRCLAEQNEKERDKGIYAC